jgi:glycosyltransferase involved in cell wall biosynthesis
VTVHRLSRVRCPVDPAEFDLLHLHSLSLSELALEMAHRYGLPLAYTAHSLLWHELTLTPEAAFWVQVQEHILRNSAGIVFLTEADREAALDRLGGTCAPSVVIPNGLGPGRAPSAQHDPRQIVFAGRFTRQKGVRLLDALIRELLPAQPVRFVLAGGHGDPACTQIVAGLVRAFPRVCTAVGWLEREALQDLLAGAGLVLVPSEYEPFGLVALEAMQAGTPVLASAVGGLREVAAAGSGGVALPADRPDLWRQAVLELLADGAWREQLSRQGPPWVAAHFSAGPLAARLVQELYQPLMAGGARSWLAPPAKGRRQSVLLAALASEGGSLA